jgi:hypothetical protein
VARPSWLVPALVLLGLLALGAAGAVLLAGRGDDSESGGATTLVRTVTERGTTREVRVTVTTQAPAAEPEPSTAPPAPPTTAPAAAGLSLAQAKALQDESTAAMRRGDWTTALGLAQRALARLRGTADIYEGYANYNVGRSLIELGNCEAGLPYIDASEQIQGSRSEFAQARAKC